MSTHPGAPAQLAIVIPALNAGAGLAATLAALVSTPVPTQVVVVDGGSDDATREIALDAGARVLDAPRGRGSQILAGIDAVDAPWLLILHADTRLEPAWAKTIAGHMADPANVWRAGYFRFVLDDPDAPGAPGQRV